MLFEEGEDAMNHLEDETFCRNGRWKEPWKVEGRVRERQAWQVPLHWRRCSTVRCGTVRAARRGRVRQERRSLAQSLGGLGVLPLGYSPRLVPSFTGTQSVAQALGICASALGAAGSRRRAGRYSVCPCSIGKGGRGGLGLDPRWIPPRRLVWQVGSLVSVKIRIGT